MVAAAVVGGAVVGAGASAFSSHKASQAQKHAANQATDAQLQMYDQTRSDLMPYQNAGQQALNPLMGLLGIGGSPGQMQQTLNTLPGYQFTLGQGLKSVQNSAAARGLGSSGAALKGAAGYATGLANSQYGNYVNQLMGMAQLGQNSAAQTGAYGTQTAANVGNNLIGAGNAQAASNIATGNAISGAANNIGGYAMFNSLYGGGAGYGGGGHTDPLAGFQGAPQLNYGY